MDLLRETTSRQTGGNSLFKHDKSSPLRSVKKDARAEIAGINRLDFLLAISRLGVFAFPYTAEDVLKEVENVKRRHLVRLFSSKGGFAI